MTVKEKVNIIDKFILGLSEASFPCSVADIIEMKRLPSKENKNKFKIIEYEVERLDLVEFVRGGDNTTLGGQKYYFISGKGLDLITSGKSSWDLFEDQNISTNVQEQRELQIQNWSNTVFFGSC